MRTDAVRRATGPVGLLGLLWVVLLAVMCAAWPGRAHAQNIEAVLAPGELTQGHAKYEKDCTNCHVRFSPKGQDALCADCHKEVKQDLQTHQGFQSVPHMHGNARVASYPRLEVALRRWVQLVQDKAIALS